MGRDERKMRDMNQKERERDGERWRMDEGGGGRCRTARLSNMKAKAGRSWAEAGAVCY